MIIQNPILTGSVALNGLNLTATNLATTSSNSFTSDQSITGSLGISANTTIAGTLTVTGSIVGLATSASYVLNAVSSSKALSASYSDTASFANSFNVAGNLTASNAVLSGTLTAQTLVVQTITSSIDFVTGSTRFGSLLTNTHTFTGSVSITGSLTVNTTGTEFQVTNNGVVMGNLLTDSHRITGSLSVTGSNATFFGSVGVGTAPSITAGITELAIGTSNTNPLISGIRDGVNAFSLSSDSAGTKLIERRNLNLILGTNNTTRLTIADNGAATFSSSVTMGGDLVLTPTDSAISFTSGAGRFFAGGSERIRITSGGLIGIGTTNPTGSLSLKAEVTNTPTLVFQNVSGGPNSAISNFTSAVQTFTVIGTNMYVNSTANIARFNTSYEGSGITFDEGVLRFSTGTSGMTPTARLTINNVGTATFTGQINNTMGNNSLFFNNTSATTGYHYMKIGNTSGGLLIGVEGSTAANLQTGDAAYSSVITTSTDTNLSLGTNQVERLRIGGGGAITIPGSLSKGSGTFRIDHPLESKKDTHQLVHSFVEGPRADLIYRGTTTLVNGTATINIDTSAGMTEGTFVALNRETQFFITNQSGWNNIKGSLHGNILTIEAEDTNSTDTIAWMVVGERQDKHIKDTDWTDENGKPILEPLKIS